MARQFITNIVLKGADRLSRPLQQASKNFKKFETSVDGATKKMRKLSNSMRNAGQTATASLTLPIAAFGTFAFRAGLEFEKAMNKVAAKTGATGEELKSLRDLAEELGSTTQFTAAQAGDGMAFLAQAGFEVNEILSATPGLLNLAAAGELELARAADIASNIMGAFRIEAEKTNEVADVLSKVTVSSNTNLEQLAEAMSKVAPVADRFGLSIQDTASAIGLLGNIGVQGTEAGTALRRALINLSAPTSGARKMIEALGVSVDDGKGNLKSFNDIMEQLGTRLEKLPQKTQLRVLNELFGARGIVAAAELTQQATSGAFAQFTESVNQADGSAQKIADTLLRGLPGAVVRFTSAFNGMQIKISKVVEGELITLLKTLTELSQTIQNLDPAVLKLGTKVAAFVAIVGPLLIGLSLLLKAGAFILSGLAKIGPAIAFVSGLMAKLGVLVVGTGTAFAGLAGVLTLGGLIGIGSIIYQLVSAFGLLKDFVVQTGKAFTEDFLSPLKRVADFILKFPIEQLIQLLSLVGIESDTLNRFARSDFTGVNQTTFGADAATPGPAGPPEGEQQRGPTVKVQVEGTNASVRSVDTEDPDGVIDEILTGINFSGGLSSL